MSAPPQNNPTAVSIDDDVEVISEQIDGLKQLDGQESVSEGERYNFSIQWGAVLAGRLPRLVHYGVRELLTDTDAVRFRALCDELRTVSPLTDRLGLACPSLPAATDTAV